MRNGITCDWGRAPGRVRAVSSASPSDGDLQYQGGAFNPALAQGQASGAVRVTLAGILFESVKGSVDLPWEGLQLALGGANDRLLFFTHPSRPETVIHTADHTILHHPALAQREELRAQVGRVRTRKRTARAVALSVLLVLAGAVVALVLSKDRLVRAAANSVPVDWEVKLGDKLFGQVGSTKRLLESSELEAQFKEVTASLLKGIPEAGYPFRFHIVEDPTLNAFAMPGGHVVIHSGLLLAADSPEEIAGVLAHEVAHATRRHIFRSVISSAGLYAVLQYVIGDVSSLLATIADSSAFLLDRKFSRDFEREADDTGWDYLLRADIEPRGMIELFKKLQAEEEKRLQQSPIGGAQKALTLVSTHPATDERVRVLEARWQRLPKQSGYRKIPLDYARFKNNLRARMHSAPTSERPHDENNH